MATQTTRTTRKKTTQTQKQMGTMLMNFEHNKQMEWMDNETLLLSYLLQSGDAPDTRKWGGIADEIYAKVKPSDFYGEQHRAIYELCLGLKKRGTDANTVTLGMEVAKLKREDITINTVNLIGMKAINTPYVNSDTLIDSVLSAARIRVAGRIVMDNFGDMLNGDEDALKAIVDGCTATLDNREKSILMTDPASDMRNDYEEHKKWLMMSPEERDKTRYKTNLPAVDKMCYMRPTDMWILAGDTGAGKTVMATDFARAWAKSGKDVAYFSLEINRQMMENRAICGEGDVPVDAFIKGEKAMTREDWRNADAAKETLAEGGHLRFIDNCPTLNAILDTCRVLHAQGKLQIVIVDHLQHVDFDGKKTSNDNRYTNLCDMTMKLKAMAMKYNVLVLALSQYNRSKDNRMEGRPTLRSLRDSGSIEQDADGVLAIYRKVELMATEDGGNAPLMHKDGELLVLKNRLGETGSIPLRFQGEFYNYLYGNTGKTFKSGATEYVQTVFGREAVPRNNNEYIQRDLERMQKAMNNVAAREAQEQSNEIEDGYEIEEDDGYEDDE